MKKTKEIEFPDCWEEVKPAEWVYLLKLHFKLLRKGNITLVDIKREWCRFVLANRGIRTRAKHDYFLLVYNLSLTLEWMYVENEEGKQVELSFQSTQNLLPAWRNFKGPLSHGSDLTFCEFRQAAQMMNAYNEIQDKAYLQALCGILYRRPGKTLGKKNFDGNYREPFVKERIGFYADRIRMMPEHIQWGVYVWFAWFCQYLISGDFIIDGSRVCFSSVFSKEEKKSQEINLGMNGVLYSVAETSVFGNIEDTDNTLLMKVMLKLLSDKLLADEMLRKTQSSTR